MPLRILVLIVTGFALSGCNKTETQDFSQPIAPIKPDFELDLSATAKRLDPNHIVLRIVDRSEDGAKLIRSEKLRFESVEDAEGNSIRVQQRDSRLQTKDSNPDLPSDVSFILEVVLQGKFGDEIGNISGMLEATLGDAENISVDLSDPASASHPLLEELGMTLDVKQRTQVAFRVKGKRVAASHIVLADGEDENDSGSTGTVGFDQITRTWTIETEITPDMEIRMWSDATNQDGAPDWVVKPVEAGTVTNSELGLAGQIALSSQWDVSIEGDEEQLIAARLLDANDAPIDMRPRLQRMSQRNRWSFLTNADQCSLQARVSKNAKHIVEIVEFQNLTIEPAN